MTTTENPSSATRADAPQRGAGNCASDHDEAAGRHRPEGADEAVSGPPAGGGLSAQFLPQSSAWEVPPVPSSADPGPQEDPADRGSGRARTWWGAVRGASWRRYAAAAAIAALLLCSGGLLYATQQLKDPAATDNRALTDTAATDQVTGEVSSALTRIFAYTPTDTQSTAQAARDVLAGSAASQYQKLFGQIRQQVTTQQLTLTTRVVRAGVVTLTAHRARLLVFLDQTAQRAGGTATSAAAQLSVTAEYRAGHWRITELKAR